MMGSRGGTGAKEGEGMERSSSWGRSQEVAGAQGRLLGSSGQCLPGLPVPRQGGPGE